MWLVPVAALLPAACGDGAPMSAAGGALASAAERPLPAAGGTAVQRGTTAAARPAAVPGPNTRAATDGVSGVSGVIDASAAGPSTAARSGAVQIAATAAGPAVGVDAADPGPPALFGSDGQVAPAAQAGAPADRSLHTWAGLYASPAQYAYEALNASPYTVLVDLEAAGSAEAAVAAALVAHRWSPDTASLAYFVSAADLAAAARLANALTAEGLDKVFLLVPAAAAAR